MNEISTFGFHHIPYMKKSKADKTLMSIWILNTDFFAKTQLDRLEAIEDRANLDLYWETYQQYFSGFVRIIQYEPGFGI
jgi:hypothetical protein